MKQILNKYYLFVVSILFIGLFSKTVSAAEMKVQYHCNTDKTIVFETAEGRLSMGRELNYSPEPGNSLNLIVGNFPANLMFWIRKPYGQTNRYATVFLGRKELPETIDLGEEGQASSAVYPFQLRHGNDLIIGQCEIRVE